MEDGECLLMHGCMRSAGLSPLALQLFEPNLQLQHLDLSGNATFLGVLPLDVLLHALELTAVDNISICVFLGQLATLHLELLVANGIVQFCKITTGALIIPFPNLALSLPCEVAELIV